MSDCPTIMSYHRLRLACCFIHERGDNEKSKILIKKRKLQRCFKTTRQQTRLLQIWFVTWNGSMAESSTSTMRVKYRYPSTCKTTPQLRTETQTRWRYTRDPSERTKKIKTKTTTAIRPTLHTSNRSPRSPTPWSRYFRATSSLICMIYSSCCRVGAGNRQKI